MARQGQDFYHQLQQQPNQKSSRVGQEVMAESLSPECTPVKQEYDSCFNAWFEGYLEPAVAASANKIQREEYATKKAQEFQDKCGKIWDSYRGCVQKAVKEKGLGSLLQQAREEFPLNEPPASSLSSSSNTSSRSS